MTDLSGLMLINGVDIFTQWGAWLTEEKRGGRENLTAILTPSKVKSHVGVDIRERSGVSYSDALVMANQEREITLHFALAAESRDEWLGRYLDFIGWLKSGWLDVELPTLGLYMRMFYVESSNFKPLTYLWQEGVHASRFKVKFKEPDPII